jgi:hypothetical protein
MRESNVFPFDKFLPECFGAAKDHGLKCGYSLPLNEEHHVMF